jgi:hypothetical protein
MARIQRLQGCREACATSLRAADLSRLRTSPQAARMALHRSVSLCEQACRR